MPSIADQISIAASVPTIVMSGGQKGKDCSEGSEMSETSEGSEGNEGCAIDLDAQALVSTIEAAQRL